MTKHRFFLLDASWGDSVQIEQPDVVHQVVNVLRLKVAEQIILLDNKGFEYLSEIVKLKPLVVKVLSRELNRNEPPRKIILYQALIKKDKFEWVLEKGTEVGISEFVPVLAARSEKKILGRPDRLEAIVREAAEQSQRGVIPIIRESQDFKSVCNISKNYLNILLDPGSDVPLARYFPSIPAYDHINLLIGPEGGFTAEEIAQARQCGWEAVNLGPRILRTETAGVIAAGALLIATQV